MAIDNNTFTKDPGELLEDYQSGVYSLTEDEKPNVIPQSGNTPEPEQPISYEDVLRATPLSNRVVRDYTREAKEAGFGSSRYDSDYYPGMDLEQNRALEQSGFAKIGTGLLKGGVTAATTAVETTLGTVFGLGSALFELAADNNGNGRGVMDTINAGVNNWLSNQLIKIQNWAEEAMPNYRTEEERSEQYQREWWKHMGTANFIGDSFLKNFGFTVGAMAGGMAWSKLIGAGLSKQLANNIMKGAVVAAEGDAEAGAALKAASEAIRAGKSAEAKAAISRAREAIARGTAVGIDTEKIVANIENAAKAIEKYGARLQLYGAAVGAMGEGTVEGIMARNEFLEEYNRNWEQQYAQDYNNIEQDILNSGDSRFVAVDYFEAPDGSVANTRVLTPAGIAELERRQREVTDNYQRAKQYAEQQGDALASTTFLLNLPILTASNTIQFGRMLSGGWKTSRNAAKGLLGGVRIADDAIESNVRTGLGVGAKTAIGALKVAGSESFEEMAQGTVSSGAKEVAAKNLASFNNAGFDGQAISSVRDWIVAMSEGGGEYLGDVKNWQEGAIGAITGLLGIPGRRWSGGVAGAYREAKDEVDTARAAAQTLNNIVNAPDFQERWRSYIRHLKYDNDMNNAIQKDDEYAWHTAADGQLINDIMAFADAGRLEDLNRIVSYYSNVSAEDAAEIRNAVKDEKNPEKDWTRNLSDNEVISKVNEQATAVKDAIAKYKDIYSALSARAPEGTSKEFLKELVYTAQQIDFFEGRFMKMFGETMDAVEPVLREMSIFGENGEILQNKEEILQRFDALRNAYEKFFGLNVLNQHPDTFRFKKLEKSTNEAFDLLEGFAEGNDEVVKKIRDMRKLMNSRRVFYEKLLLLQDKSGAKKHEEQAKTQEQMDKESVEAMADIETDGLDSFEKIREAYISKNAKDQAEFLNTLSSIEEKNPHAKQFLGVKRKLDGFQEFVEKNDISIIEGARNPAMQNWMLNDLIHRVSSDDDLKNMPDSVFAPLQTFQLQFRNSIFPIDAAAYSKMKDVIRSAMRRYLGLSSDTSSRENISETPVTPSREGEIDSATPDASQPASSASATLPDWMKGESPEPEKAKQPEQEKPAEAPENPVTESEKAGITAMASSATSKEISEDAEMASQEEQHSSPNVEVGDNEYVSYYQASAPEVATEENNKARSGDRENADLSDFLDYLQHKADAARKNAEEATDEKEKEEYLKEEKKWLKDRADWEKTWNALNDAGAFEAVATKLSVNDEVEFVIDPAFNPQYDGGPQILMTTMIDRKRQVLSILSEKVSTYYGLRELREKILSEYEIHKVKNPNDPYVFGKKSRVWAKPSGQIDYDYSRKEEDEISEPGIRNIRGYSPDAPIVFINRNGEAVVVRGRSDVLKKLSPGTFSGGFRNNRKGSLYYLAQNGDDSYIPVRLFVEHFRESNKDSANPVFVKARGIITDIATQAQGVNKISIDWNDENEKLREKLGRLMNVLDARDIYLELGNYNNIGPALMVVTWDRDEDGNRINKDVQFRTPDQLTADWLIDKIAGMNNSFQVTESTDISEYVDNDILTSNARMLRPKGVNFYIDPWDPESQSFKPMTAEEIAAHKAKEEKNDVSKNEPHETSPVQDDGQDEDSWEQSSRTGVQSRPNDEDVQNRVLEYIKNNPGASLSDVQRGLVMGFMTIRNAVNALVDSGKIKSEQVGGTISLSAIDSVQESIQKSESAFASLPENTRTMLEANGWTEEEFNNSPKDVQQYAIDCAGS